ncbi:calcium-binding protein [Paenibacillus tepidiphilus]|uniref:calcium-binding protein n=1 Tax=Paenibacillus tepidiphilus TaxID=2608683 RepID=UPI0013A5996F|nr:calcium-binding protein [Paenibacillus tepidiphilus]
MNSWDFSDIIDFVETWRSRNGIPENAVLTADQTRKLAMDVQGEVGKLSFKVPTEGGNIIPYSGTIGDIPAYKIAEWAAKGSDGKLYFINDTQAGALLNNRGFMDALELAAGDSAVSDALMNGKYVNDVRTPYGTGEVLALNDYVSKNVMLTNAHGNVITLTGGSLPFKVWSQTELPTLLEMPEVLSIDGIPREDLLRAKNQFMREYGFSEAKALDGVRELIAYKSKANMAEIVVYRGPQIIEVTPEGVATVKPGQILGVDVSDLTGGNRRIPEGTASVQSLGEVGGDLSKAEFRSKFPTLTEALDKVGGSGSSLVRETTALVQTMDKTLTQTPGKGLQEAYPVLSEASRYSRVRTGVLKGLGVVGGVMMAVDAVNMISQASAAYAAGDTDLCNDIIRDWTFETAGGLATSQLFMEAVAPFALALGTAGGPLGIAAGLLLEVGAGIIGWTIGSELGKGLSDLVDGLFDLFNTAEETISPLVLDLDGDGVETTSIKDGIAFDHDNNSFAEKSAWAGADDGLLVRDLNGNGRIDGGAELFGNNTLLADGSKAANGFAALAELDGNHDGKVDANDTAFAELQIWKDLDGDGITDSGELLSLEEAGVASISTGYSSSTLVDVNGNEHKQVGTYTKSDGTTAAVNDVWFKADKVNSTSTDPLKETAEIAALPDLKGFGTVNSLHQAMLRDSTGYLKALVVKFAAETDVNVRKQLTIDIIFAWTGVEGISPDARGGIIDARQLCALEKLFGEKYTESWSGQDTSPGSNASALLKNAFDQLAGTVYSQLTAQTQLKAIYSTLTLAWDPTTGSVRFDLSGLASDIMSLLSTDEVAGRERLSEVSANLHQLELTNLVNIETFRKTFAAKGEEYALIIDTAGKSEVLGTRENDSFSGSNAAEVFWGMAGDDTISGNGGADILFGDGGNDTLYGGELGDKLVGGTGDDRLYGGSGSDVLDGGAGNDTLYGGDSSDTSYQRGNGDDIYMFGRGSGQDIIIDYDGTEGNADRIKLGEHVLPGEVSLRRSGNNLELAISGSGDKLVVTNYFEASGKYVIEAIQFADGTVWGPEVVRQTVLRINGGEASESLSGYEGDDQMYGYGGDDTLTAAAGNDYLAGGYGDDRLYGNDGEDRLVGESGGDKLYGGAGNDVLDGGEGNDTLYGGDSSDTSYTRANGNDTYLFGRGYGQDTIVDYDGTEGNADIIKLTADVLPGDITVRRSGSSLELSINGTSDKLTVSSFFDTSGKYVVESVQFADGTVWDAAALRTAALDIHGTESGETVAGYETNDVLRGYGGSDTIYGGLGGDVLDGGAGNDTLYGGDSNDTSYTRANGNDTYLFGRGYGQDTVIDYDGTAGNADSIKFAADVLPSEVTVRRSGSSLELSINGTSDKLTVSSFFDTSGKYVVESVQFADGTVWNEAALRAAALNVNGGEAANTLDGYETNDLLRGYGGDDTLSGSAGDDVLNGGAGNDTLYGGDRYDSSYTRANGNDTYLFGRGYGQDTITDYDGTEGNADLIKFAADITPGDISVRRSGSSLELSINGTSDKLTVSSFFETSGKYVVEAVQFADGTVWDAAALRTAVLNVNGTEASETLTGYEMNDALRGYGGDDIMSGNAGADDLDGGAGSDTLYGNSGTDRLSGGSGTDTLYGGLGDDVLDGGAGNDTLYGGDSNDTSYTRANGNDTYLFGRGYGQDTVIDYDGTAGNADSIKFAADVLPGEVTVRRSGSNLELSINGTSDKLTVSSFFDTSGKYVVESVQFADGTVWNEAALRAAALNVNGGEAANTLDGYETNDVLRGYGNDDTLSGSAGDDVLDGGAGNDTLYGGDRYDSSYTRTNGNDTYLFGRGYGQDTITDYDGTEGNADLIKFAADITPGDITIRRSSSSLELSINGTSDKLTVSNFFDASGKYVVESVQFADGTVWDAAALRAAVLNVNGTEANESLTGYEMNDVLRGYGGDDTLSGNAGADDLDGGAGSDTLYGNSGTDRLSGGSGTDTLYGGLGDDVLDGGAGNDTLYGGDSNDTSYTRANGNDTFLFGRGYGQDTVIDYDGTAGNADSIKFAADVLPSEVTVRRSGSSLELSINGTSDKLTVSSFFDTSGKYVVESVQFADGTVWNEAALRAAALNVNGGEAANTLDGYETNDLLRGYGNDDTLSGSAGDDVLDGGAGNDTLYGGDRYDSSYTRANGNDTYLFGRGYGQDTIIDYDGTEGNADLIQFAADVKPGDITVRRSSSSLELSINGTSDKLTVSNFFETSGKYVVESVQFADGTVWDAAVLRAAVLNVNGTEASETLTGYELNDVLRGYGGDDTLSGNAGEDVLDGGAGSDILYGNAGSDRLSGGSGTDALYGGLGDDVLDGSAGNDTLYGGDSNDTSYTRANGNDTYLFGRGYGQDTIVDYDGTAGNADIIKFAADVLPGEVTVRRSGSNLELSINGTGDKLTVSGFFETGGKYVVESVQFADGTVWNEAALRAAALNVNGSEAGESLGGYETHDVLRGYGGDDTISGSSGNDVLDGGAGNDTLYGGDRYDTSYTRANGNDTYLFGRGYGQDTIIDYDGTEGNTDIIKLAADLLPDQVTLRRSGSNLELSINGTSDKLTVANYFDASGKYVVEEIRFADGTSWDSGYVGSHLTTAPTTVNITLTGTANNDQLTGGAGQDTLSGGAGDDVLDGGAGNDTLYGGDRYDSSYTRANGNDTYLFGRGYGQDTITDYDGTEGNSDTIMFAADVLPADVTVRRSGSSLELSINGTGDKLTVSSFFEASGKYTVETVQFADGTVWDIAALRAAVLNVNGSEAGESLTGYEMNDMLRGYGGDDTLSGNAGDDLLDGGAGSDTLYGNAGSDRLAGGSGNDTLYGGSEDDVLDGGAGNDTLYGGESNDTSYTRANGSDTYLFGRGYGQDNIVDYDGTAGNADTIRFAADVLPGEVTVRRSGSSLELSINGTSDKLTVSSFFETSGKYVVESVQFADGTVWDAAALRTAALNVNGSDASDTLDGYETNDVLRGYSGDDRLSGSSGDDVLDGGAGNDTLYGGDQYDTSYTRANGNDTYLFGRGYGQDTVIDYDGTEGNADMIKFAVDVLPGEVTVRRSGSSLELSINGTNDKLKVSSFFETSGKYVVESVQFADGTVWDAAALRKAVLNVNGSEAGESLTGYETGDVLRGYGGDDTLTGNAGDDDLDGGAGSDTLYGNAGSDRLTGGIGGDILYGGSEDDVLDGGTGNDTLYGGDSNDTSYTRANGSDTYIFGRGYGQDTIVDYDGTSGNTDTIRFAADVLPSEVTVRRNGSSLELSIEGTSDILTVSSFFETGGKYVVESVQFADGTLWDAAALRAAALNVNGSELSESLSGYETNDSLRGYGGDDSLSGSSGDDVLDGGAGNDTLYGGDRYDSSYTRANGNDTYLFGRGYGQDTITDYDGTVGNADIIKFAADVLPSEVKVRRSGSSLELSINGTSDKLTVSSFFESSGKYVVESVQFADGTLWDAEVLRAAVLNVNGTEASETLTGYEKNDVLRGYGGDDQLTGNAGDDDLDGGAGIDTLYGNAGSDRLSGGIGGDTLYGGSDDDVLDGGAGNDTLYGGDSNDTSYTRANGSDTYIFGRGYGQDIIVDYDGTAGNADTIRFAADVLPGEVTVRRSGSSLEFSINGTSDKLTVSSFFDTSGKYVVESVQFADGTVWNEAALRAAALQVNGSDASDTLDGYETGDFLRGFAGDDKLSGSSGDDVLDGGAGNDTLYGGDRYDSSYTRANGNDTYLFGRGYGQDTIVDYDGTEGNADIIKFAADVKPGDITVRRSGSSLELGINGTSDKLTVSSFFDTSGKYVVESVQFADGTVWNAAALRAAVLNVNGTEAGDTLTGYELNDVLNGYGGDDQLTGNAGDDLLDGGAGSDTLYGNAGSDRLLGGSGNDTLYGGSEDDVLDGSAGNDTLYGGDQYDTSYTRANGNDTYLFGRGYGQDTIVDYDGTAGNADAIKFAADVLPEEVTVRRSGSNLELGINGTSDKLTVLSFFEAGGKYAVESVQFAEGTVWNEAALRAAVLNVNGTEAANTLDGYETNDVLRGYGGDDTLSGSAGNDVLDGGAGNDTLYGGDRYDGSYTRANGNDTYLFGRGYGQDIIVDYDGTEGNADLIKFAAGIMPEDITVRRSGSSLELSINGTGDKLTVSSFFETSGKYVVESVQFADGTVWDAAALRTAVLNVNGTEASETLTGYELNDVLRGYGGDDQLTGNAGDDLIDGGAGADTLYGNAGKDRLSGGTGGDILQGGADDDVLDGGKGNDTLYGGESNDTSYTRANGNDTYLFGRGYGQDIIIDYDGTAGNADTIKLAADVLPDEVTVRRSGSSLELSINGTTDKLTVSSFFDASGKYVVESVQFADGTVWDAAYLSGAVRIISGGEAGESLTGYEGDDTLYGYEGNDTLTGAAGNDSLYGGDGGDTLYGNDGDDRLAGEGGGDILYGGAGVDLLEGGVGNDNLYGNEGADLLKGEDGEDKLYGGTGNDVLDGGAGTDTLYGGDTNDTSYNRTNGNDTYLFGHGSGQDTVVDYDGTEGNKDTILLADNISPEDIRLRRSGTQLEVRINQTGDTLKVTDYFKEGGQYRIEEIRFADGTVWDYEYVRNAVLTVTGSADNDTLSGNDTDDFIYGLEGDDTVNALGGNDLVYGGAGNDTLNGMNGNDSLYGGDGNDIIAGDNGADQLYGEAGEDTLSGLSGEDTLYGGDGNDTLAGGTEKDALYGGDGDDTLFGGAGSDVLDGGAGNDYLLGNNDDFNYDYKAGDTYIFGKGYGQDRIYDYDTTAGNVDTIEMRVKPAEIEVLQKDGNLTLRIMETGEQLTIRYYFNGPAYQIERITFADGTVWGKAELEANVLTKGTEEADTLYGLSSYDDKVTGLGGNDTLYGYSGNDALYGGNGDDTLFGGAGTDVLDGGAGNDYLLGNNDDYTYDYKAGDTYVFGKGYGQDRIYDYDTTTGNIDTIQMLVNPADIEVLQQDGNLMLRIIGTGEQLTIRYYYNSSAYQIERITFADGTVWGKAELEANVLTKGTEAADALYGLNGVNDNLYGYGNNDTLQGYSGNDKLYGGDGDDILFGGAGNDVLDGGAGNDYLLGNNDDYTNGTNGGDTYIFGKGYGQDRIYDYDSGSGNIDTIEMRVNPADIEVLQKDGNLTLRIIETGEQLTIRYYFNSSYYQIEKVAFADGTVWGKAELEANVLTLGTEAEDTLYGVNGVNDNIYGYGNSDNLYGYSGKDNLYGGAGGDTLYGGADNDNLLGGDGDDTLFGGAGTDVLDGGAGNDYLLGSSDDFTGSANGGDTYIFGKGYGQDRIYDYDTGSGNIDTIEMRVNPADIEVVQKDGNLTLRIIETGEQLTIRYYFNSSYYQIEKVAFADGTVWGKAELEANVLTLGTEAEDTLYGVNGLNDNVYGYGSDDALYGYSGKDNLYGGEGNDTLYAGADNDQLLGGAGNDTLFGGAGSDVLDGGAGNDYLLGNNDDFSTDSRGGDTYVFGKGYGQDKIYDYDTGSGNTDIIKLLVNSDEVVFSKNANDLVIEIMGSTDRATVTNWYTNSYYQTEVLTAQDGTQIKNTQIEQLVQAMATYSSSTGIAWSQAVAEKRGDALQVLAQYWTTTPK